MSKKPFSYDMFAQRRALVGMGAMAPSLFEDMLIGTHTFLGKLNEL